MAIYAKICTFQNFALYNSQSGHEHIVNKYLDLVVKFSNIVIKIHTVFYNDDIF